MRDVSDEARVRHYLAVSAISAAVVVATYLVFVRTSWGQHIDDIAFDGRSVEDPAITADTNDLLHSVTRSTLFLLTAAIVVFALARGRWRLAGVAGASITAAVVTSEVLKNEILTRPQLDDVAGIEQNSLPSGHATIGMVLALGLVMVAPHAWRWAATGGALVVAVVFGVGVIATGWHRPSDVVAAYGVSAMWFGLGTALLITWRGSGNVEMGSAEERLDGRIALAAGVLTVLAAVLILVQTFTADGLRTVQFAADYLAVAVVVITLGVAVVAGYAQSLRGVSLDPR